VLSGLKETIWTSSPLLTPDGCLNIARLCPSAAFHNRAVPSALPVPIKRPFGE
jgi:hypothetical protein